MAFKPACEHYIYWTGKCCHKECHNYSPTPNLRVESEFGTIDTDTGEITYIGGTMIPGEDF